MICFEHVGKKIRTSFKSWGRKLPQKVHSMLLDYYYRPKHRNARELAEQYPKGQSAWYQPSQWKGLPGKSSSPGKKKMVKKTTYSYEARLISQRMYFIFAMWTGKPEKNVTVRCHLHFIGWMIDWLKATSYSIGGRETMNNGGKG